MNATAPKRTAEPESELCVRRHCSTARRNTRRAAPWRASSRCRKVAQPLRHRQHPLLHWQAWEDVIRQMRRGLHHAPGIARRAHATSLAGERDQEVVAAVAAPRTREAVGEDAALQVAAELTLDIFRNRTVVVVAVAALGEPVLEVLLDAAIEHALARAARPVPRGCAVPGPALDLHACPLSPAFRGWGSAWRARGTGRNWPQGLGRGAHGGLGGCGGRS